MDQLIGLTELCERLCVDLRPSVLELANRVDKLFDDGLQFRIDHALPSPGRFDIIEGRPYIIARPDASESVIAHELLHAELRGLGFVAPELIIRFNEKDESLLTAVHGKLANVIEHKRMFPRFKELGLDVEEFVGLKDTKVDDVIRSVKARQEPQNPILRAHIATLYVELSADYAFGHGAAEELTKSLRNDLFRLFTVCQALKKHIDASTVSSPEAYTTVFIDSFKLLGISVVGVDGD